MENFRQPASQPRAPCPVAAVARWLDDRAYADGFLDVVRTPIAPAAGAVGDIAGSGSQATRTGLGRSSGQRTEIAGPAVGGGRSRAVYVAVSRRRQSGRDP